MSMKYLKRYNEGIFDFLKGKKEEPKKEEPKKEEPKEEPKKEDPIKEEPKKEEPKPKEPTREEKILNVLDRLKTLYVFRDKLLDLRGSMYKISYDDSDFTLTSRQGYVDLINKKIPEGLSVDNLTVKFDVGNDLVVSDVIFDIEYTIEGEKKKTKLALIGSRYNTYLQEIDTNNPHNRHIRFAPLHELLYRFEYHHDDGVIRDIRDYFIHIYSKINVDKFRESISEEILDDIFADIKDISSNMQINREEDWVGFTVSLKMKGIQPMQQTLSKYVSASRIGNHVNLTTDISKFILNNKISKIFAELPSIEGRLKDINKNIIIYVTMYKDAMSFSIVPKLEDRPNEELIDEGLLSFFKKPKPKKIDIDVLKELLQSDLEDVKFGYDVKPYDVMEQIDIIEDDFVCQKNGHPILYDVSGNGMAMHKALNAKSKNKGYIIYLLPKSPHTVPIGLRSALHIFGHLNKQRMNDYGIDYCLYHKDNQVGILFYNL